MTIQELAYVTLAGWIFHPGNKPYELSADDIMRRLEIAADVAEMMEQITEERGWLESQQQQSQEQQR